MGFFTSCWEAFLQVTTYAQILSMTDGGNQQPLHLPEDDHAGHDHHGIVSAGLSFQVPGTNFTCSYPTMTGYTACNSASNRSCWLQAPTSENRSYDINTDYESFTPTGIRREYWLEVDLEPMAPDGYLKPLAQVFNHSYPGPELVGCWGDEFIVHVTNKIPNLGTTVHWHGVRQFGTNQQDGVNGVTQCPIAYNQTYTYTFATQQYGHTWYHSHYQTQYSDGVAGPLTIHGPSSAAWDETFTPILMNDWVHANTSDAFTEELAGGIPVADSLLLGGLNTFKCSNEDPYCCVSCNNNAPECAVNPRFCCTPDQRCFKDGVKQTGGTFNKTVTADKRYLLKLINASSEAMFIFSIDGHDLLVIATDLVPIVPYTTDSVFIGIGQRYQVIITAKPKSKSPACQTDVTQCNYWIRTRVATNCGTVAQDDETTGILQYSSNRAVAIKPTTLPGTQRSLCEDEPVENLRPVLQWNVDELVNSRNDFTFDADISSTPYFGAFRWDLTDFPLFLDYSNPTLLNVENQIYLEKNFNAVVNYSNPAWNDGFVYLVITGRNLTSLKRPIPAAHPIHLHGHDFVILAQTNSTWDGVTIPKNDLINPPRRDVALLYSGGYLALAFKLDNPGIWLVHCHIAWHASSGLALQVLERQQDILPSIGSLTATQDTCKGWDAMNLQFAQDDSGI